LLLPLCICFMVFLIFI